MYSSVVFMSAGFVALPSSHSVSVSSRCTPSVPTCLVLIVGPFEITCHSAMACPRPTP